MEERYLVRIVRRDFQGQTKADFHATVTRKSDGLQLMFISGWRWVLRVKVRYGALRRAFKRHDKQQRKLSEVEAYER